MKDNQLSIYESNIINALTKTKAQVEQFQNTIRSLQAGTPDVADESQNVEELEKITALCRNANIIKSKLETALKRLKEGDYGYCEECGVEIQHQRLMATPFAIHCVPCLSISEIKNKIHHGKGRGLNQHAAAQF